jgi:UDP-glucose 4-epimerase
MVERGDLIAVTGAAGALGKRLVSDLAAAGFRVRALTRTALRTAIDGIEHAPFDLLASGDIGAAVLAGCSAVVHLAAHIPKDHDDPANARTCLEANAAGTIRLLQAMERAGIRRFLHTTAANAYAAGVDFPDETAPLYPSHRASFYLTSKVAQEILAEYWSRRSGMETTALRAGALYGAGQDHGLFTGFSRALLQHETIQLVNGGSYGADFVTIADVSRALLMFLENGRTGPFNIATGLRTTIMDAATLLIEITGAPRELLIVEPEDRLDAGFPAIDISKARALGFEPTHIREGLNQLVQWVETGA